MRMCVPEIGSDQAVAQIQSNTPEQNAFSRSPASQDTSTVPAAEPAPERNAFFRRSVIQDTSTVPAAEPAPEQNAFFRRSVTQDKTTAPAAGPAPEQNAFFQRSPVQEQTWSRSEELSPSYDFDPPPQRQRTTPGSSGTAEYTSKRSDPADFPPVFSRGSASAPGHSYSPAPSGNDDSGAGRPAAELMKNRRPSSQTGNRRNGFHRSGRGKTDRHPSRDGFRKGKHFHGRKGTADRNGVMSGPGPETRTPLSGTRPVRRDRNAGYVNTPPPPLTKNRDNSPEPPVFREPDRSPVQETFFRQSQPPSASYQTTADADRWRIPADDNPHQNRSTRPADPEPDRNRTRRHRPNALKGS